MLRLPTSTMSRFVRRGLRSELYGSYLRLKLSRGDFPRLVDFPEGGFQIIEKDASIIVPRKSRLHYYKDGITKRLNFLRKEYLGDFAIPFEEGDIVVDCGANIGEFVRSLDLGPAQKIFAFEPDPTEHRALSRNIGDHAMAVNKALWHEDTEIEIFLANERGDSGVYSTSQDSPSVMVSACRLDTFLAQHAPTGIIRLIKIEGEGAEPEILEGALGVLDRTHFITVDVGPERGEENESTLVPIVRTLIGRGFELIHFNPERMTCLFENAAISGAGQRGQPGHPPVPAA